MRCKKLVGSMALTIAAGALTLAPAYAEMAGGSMTGDMSTDGTMGGDMSMSMTGSMSNNMDMSQPMPVSGQVLRYYTDRSGYVTAMDVQTADGVRMVRFSPGMGQRLYTTYPAGGNIDAYIMGSPVVGMNNTMRYDLVGMGTEPPRAGFMQPYMVSDVDLLEAEPYVMAGAGEVLVQGTLADVVTNKRGEVLGLIVDVRNAAPMEAINQMGDRMSDNAGTTSGEASMGGDASMGATGGDASMGGGMMGDNTTMMGGMMNPNRVLIRVPRNFRHVNPGIVGTARVAQLFKGSDVKAVGLPEAPRYGAMSTYGQRVIASALVLNGRSVGAVGIPRMAPEGRAAFKVNVAGTNESESAARSMGYIPYSTGVTGGDMSMGGDMGGTMGSTDMGGMGGTGMGDDTGGGM